MSIVAPNTYPIPIELDSIKAYCERYGIREFALFGSILRDDFDDESDVDVLVEYEPGRGMTFENMLELQAELEAIFRRKVDIVEKSLIRKRIRRASILKNYRVVYAA